MLTESVLISTLVNFNSNSSLSNVTVTLLAALRLVYSVLKLPLTKVAVWLISPVPDSNLTVIGWKFSIPSWLSVPFQVNLPIISYLSSPK